MLDQQERAAMQGLADWLRSQANVIDLTLFCGGSTLRAWADEVEAARRCAAAPQTAPAPVVVLNALDVLSRLDAAPTQAFDAAGFLKLMGERGLWVIANPLDAARPRLQGQT